jgi:hypothetical protein
MFADASEPIRGTQLIFGEDGIVIIGRSCVVNGERKQHVETGDQFVCVKENDGRKKFVVTSREKINGVVITREIEEFLLETFEFIEAARLVVFEEQLFVFIKRREGSVNEVEIPAKFNIRDVLYVDQFPITTNGTFNRHYVNISFFR